MTARAQEGVAVPSGLRERVLAASRQARPAGLPVPEVPAISPAEACSRAGRALSALLSVLGPGDWHTPALRGLDVQGLVGHLIGVEADVQRALAGDSGLADANHVDSTQPAADRQTGRDPAETQAEWSSAAQRTLLEIHALPGAETEMAIYGMRLPLGALLVVRAFELWTHENDIRKATGRPPSVPDVSTLRLMTDLAVGLLPAVASLTGMSRRAEVHMVLTGPGGGTWDVALGDAAQAPVPVSLVTGAVGFCRLAANRVRPADLDVYVTGDPGCAAGVLAVVPALALD